MHEPNNSQAKDNTKEKGGCYGFRWISIDLFICYKNFHISGSYLLTWWVDFRTVLRYLWRIRVHIHSYSFTCINNRAHQSQLACRRV